ncbi:MAG TPA: hypothetical protein VMN78_09715 [Longimicrobiales bacterium]|nr:hypothetical protein [Longimicrobiales bacterium]
MTARNTTSSTALLPRALLGAALLWAATSLPAGRASDEAGAVIIHASTDRDARDGGLAAPARARLIDIDVPVAAMPGSSARLVELGPTSSSGSRTGAPGETRVHVSPCDAAVLASRAPPTAHVPPPPVSREPTFACGFVSARPTAPPPFRS